MPSTFLEAARERVVVYDGAFGTYMQGKDLGADDFGGAALEGCNEMLVLTRPDLVAEMHDAFFAVGVDVVETATFGAFAVPLNEYGLGDRAHEINVAAARIAREVASGYPGRWVSGSMGPGTKMPTLRHISFADLRDAYEVQARGLIEGGVDVLLVETQYDLLGAKAGIIACRRAMSAVGREVPIQVQVTMENTGRMLVGTEISAACTALLAMRPDVIGVNCATGPREMSEHLRHLASHSTLPVACLPNAGLPTVVEGKMHYDLTPDQLAEFHARFITELGVSVVGGCCGTTPEHLAVVVERCRDLTPGERSPSDDPGLASLYSHTSYDQTPSYLAVGERTNANGSRKFRELMLDEEWDACVRMAQDAVGEGSHVVDLCVDYVGEDGVRAMDELASRFATQVTIPVMLDSTEAPVIEAGLQWIGGKAVLNSVNLEDGAGPGTRLDRFLSMARDYGAAVVCTCIDEQGQARDAEWKLRAARQIYELAVSDYGIAPEDLLFDPLALTLATGIEESRRDGIETLEGIRAIKASLPGAKTILGLSNISFGLSPAARHVLNSVYLHECQEAGLDAAIVHAARILPLNRIDPEHVKICLDLIYDRRDPATGYDPLQELLRAFEGVSSAAVSTKEDRSGWPVEERLKQRIIDGDREGLDDDLAEALASGRTALSVVNDDLLSGMKVVGELFGSGQMQLPFVLQSAETMKAAVRYLEPHMEKADQGGKGTLVLATVKGDVHDIGKNLVDIILTNNGYTVHNLGIKVAVTEMIEKALEVGADAIGMSGLLVKSTLIMRENLEELNARALSAEVPVLLGGAALTRTYVERDLRTVYEGRVFYGKDAFEGLRTMDRLMELKKSGEVDAAFGRAIAESDRMSRADRVATERAAIDPATLPFRSPEVALDALVFEPPFLGTKVVKGVSMDDIASYLNETALFRTQWGFRPDKARGESDGDFKVRIRSVLREQLAAARASGVLVPQVVYGYFAVGSDGDDLVVFSDASRSVESCRFTYPRQIVEPYLCIADFFRPAEGEAVDYAAFHIVTMGEAVTEAAAAFKEADRYQDYLFLHGLGVEMTEALAELWHRRIREEWGFASEDGPSLSGLFKQQYRGGRYSWGYPACPDLEDNEKVATLLDAARIGVEVSEETSYQYHPEQTTSAIIVPHPQAKYFVA
ncbi:MAG TPA: methionine synthase [Acidimicrobiales bacterium]|nr:methionine synthase [Acidimicrobiales bacterium]